MDHIKETDLTQIKQLLETRLAALPTPNHELNGFQEPHDFTDAATVLSEQSYSVKDWQRFELTHQLILEATDRIADGEYGECEDCGDEIPVGRLLASPLSTRCVECQEAAEVKKPTIRKGLLEEFDPL